METLKTNPELMQVIINIQLMKSKIDSQYDQYADFKNLEKLPAAKLYSLQDSCIQDYNKTFTNI